MNKKQFLNLLSWVFLASTVLYFAYAKGWVFAGFDSISPKEASKMIQNDQTVFLLDVRTPKEFAEEFIEGATLIPLQTLENNLAKIPHDKTIVVYCHSGMRSVAASRLLAEHGYTPLNVKGGISNWKSEGLQVITGTR